MNLLSGWLRCMLRDRPATKNDMQRLENKIMALQDVITALTEEVSRNTSVEKSALTTIQTLAAQLAAALASATNAGATPEQLAALQTLSDTLNANDTELAAAIAANTTPATPPA